MTIRSIDVNVLRTLAATLEQKKELTQFGIPQLVDDEIAAMIREEEEKERTEATRAAVREIIKINDMANSALLGCFGSIKTLHQHLAATRKKADQIILARAYGAETRNYLPLTCVVFETGEPLENSTIPPEWLAKNATKILASFKELAKVAKKEKAAK